MNDLSVNGSDLNCLLPSRKRELVEEWWAERKRLTRWGGARAMAIEAHGFLGCSYDSHGGQLAFCKGADCID
jgi:hypothetical protein